MLFRSSMSWVARADRSVAELTMRFNTKCYHATVADLLKRVPLKKIGKCKLQKPRKVKKHISKATL